MATLTVWKFETANGADAAMATLERLQKEELIDVLDGAVVSWPTDRKKPRTEQLHSMTGSGALGGAFWGFLLGLIFFVPFLGAAIGAGMGALTGSMVDVGIDDEFIRDVRDKITPGTSALFLLSENAVVDKVRDAFEGTHAALLHTNLTSEQENMLRSAFADA